MKKKLWIPLILGLVLTIVGCRKGGQLNIKLSENNFFIDENKLDPVITTSLKESKDLKKIKELQIDTNITDIELVGNEDNHYHIMVENIDSNYISPMKIQENKDIVQIANDLLGEIPIGILDDASSRSKLVIYGPIEEIEKILIYENIGSIDITRGKFNNMEIKANLADLAFNNSVFDNLNLNLELSDLNMSDTSFTGSKIELEKSRIFGENTEFKMDNELKLSVVEGEIGVKNYEELFTEKTNHRVRLNGRLKIFEWIDETVKK